MDRKKRSKITRNKALEAAQEYYNGFHSAVELLKRRTRQRNFFIGLWVVTLISAIVGGYYIG